MGKTIMRREPGEPLNPDRMSAADIEALKARIAPHVFASQYQQRPEPAAQGTARSIAWRAMRKRLPSS